MRGLLIILAALAGPTVATNATWAQSRVSQAAAPLATLEILPGWQLPSGKQMAAFHFLLSDGWKTYWRSPGDAGIPPRFDLAGSVNLSDVRLLWPRPRVYEDYGLRTVGYSRELILPVELQPRRPGAPVTLAGSVEIGVCREVCVPVQLDFDAQITPAVRKDARITDALATLPRPAAQAGVGRVACRIEPIEDGLRVTASVDIPSQGANEIAILEAADPSIWVSDPVVSRKGRRLTVTSDMVPTQAAPFALERGAITITVLGDMRAAEIRGCPAP